VELLDLGNFADFGFVHVVYSSGLCESLL
jgi:hypothetical protein